MDNVDNGKSCNCFIFLFFLNNAIVYSHGKIMKYLIYSKSTHLKDFKEYSV